MENCCICNTSVAGRGKKEEKGFMDHPVKQPGTYILDGELSAKFDLHLKDFLNTEGTNCLFASIAIQN